MRRREFITTIAVGATAWSLAARAQQPKRAPQIGFLTTGSLESPETRTGLNAFHQGLREHGYIDGQNIFVEVRAANSKVEQFPALANELIGLNVDLIVATNSLAAVLCNEQPPPSPLSYRLWAILLETGSFPASRDQGGTSRG
jgi:hypothetical protein